MISKLLLFINQLFLNVNIQVGRGRRHWSFSFQEFRKIFYEKLQLQSRLFRSNGDAINLLQVKYYFMLSHSTIKLNNKKIIHNSVFFRLHESLCATYESASLRRFRQGNNWEKTLKKLSLFNFKI
jgi:hypothetical protein